MNLLQNAAFILETRGEAVLTAIVVGVVGVIVFVLNNRAPNWPYETTAEGRKRQFELRGPR